MGSSPSRKLNLIYPLILYTPCKKHLSHQTESIVHVLSIIYLRDKRIAVSYMNSTIVIYSIVNERFVTDFVIQLDSFSNDICEIDDNVIIYETKNKNKKSFFYFVKLEYESYGEINKIQNDSKGSIKFWGLENWWGNKYERIHDYDNPANSLSATVNDPVNGGTRSLPIFDYRGYFPKKMKFGRYLDLIATTDDPKKGYDTLGYCDYQWWPGSTNSESRVVRRSYFGSNTGGGVACAYADNTALVTYSSGGSRLAFRGSLIEETNVETFKAIAITN